MSSTPLARCQDYGSTARWSSFRANWTTAHACHLIVLTLVTESIQRLKLFHKIIAQSVFSDGMLVCNSQMWSFGLVPAISRIFANPSYPKHHPNTVVPNYSAAMHAKYEVMEAAVKENPFNTRYFCWLDVGLFRDIAGKSADGPFSLYLPPGFRNDSVSYQEVYGRNKQVSVKDIVYMNMVWVCGCFFFAEANVMLKWTEEYKVCDFHCYVTTARVALWSQWNTV